MTAFAPTCSMMPCLDETKMLRKRQRTEEKGERGEQWSYLGHLASLGSWDLILLSPLTSYGQGSSRLHFAPNRVGRHMISYQPFGLTKAEAAELLDHLQSSQGMAAFEQRV